MRRKKELKERKRVERVPQSDRNSKLLRNVMHQSIGSLSKGVFERRTSTGSEVFFILKHLDAPKFVFLSVLTIIETSCPKRWAKPLSKNEKRPLLVDVRRSKTSLLKFTYSRLRPAPPPPGISVFFALILLTFVFFYHCYILIVMYLVYNFVM